MINIRLRKYLWRGEITLQPFDRNIAEEIYGRKEVIEENVQAIDSETGVQVVYEPVENK